MLLGQHQQIGFFSANGDVQRAGTPGANNVNVLGNFPTAFPAHGLGDLTNLERFTAFEWIVCRIFPREGRVGKRETQLGELKVNSRK